MVKLTEEILLNFDIHDLIDACKFDINFAKKVFSYPSVVKRLSNNQISYVIHNNEFLAVNFVSDIKLLPFSSQLEKTELNYLCLKHKEFSDYILGNRIDLVKKQTIHDWVQIASRHNQILAEKILNMLVLNMLASNQVQLVIDPAIDPRTLAYSLLSLANTYPKLARKIVGLGLLDLAYLSYDGKEKLRYLLSNDNYHDVNLIDTNDTLHSSYIENVISAHDEKMSRIKDENDENKEIEQLLINTAINESTEEFEKQVREDEIKNIQEYYQQIENETKEAEEIYKDSVGYDLRLMLENDFTQLNDNLKDKPYLIITNDHKYKLWGYKENKWQITEMEENFQIPKEWGDIQKTEQGVEAQKVFVSFPDKIHDTLKNGHTHLVKYIRYVDIYAPNSDIEDGDATEEEDEMDIATDEIYNNIHNEKITNLTQLPIDSNISTMKSLVQFQQQSGLLKTNVNDILMDEKDNDINLQLKK